MNRLDNTPVSQDETLYPVIEVFKTNVGDTLQADKILQRLNELFPNHKINFDLEDCDNILRVESVQVIVDVVKIIRVVKDSNNTIEILE
tara:strand:- start:952 stop:1218 length:267 start_codon:yes stop_codon:yes gene_type:complete